MKGTKQLKLDPTIYDSLQKEKVLPGDVIYIEANSGMPSCYLALLMCHQNLLQCKLRNVPQRVAAFLVGSLMSLLVNADFSHIQDATLVQQSQTYYDCLCQKKCCWASSSSMNCAGAVKRVGRCDAYATEFDLEAEEYVPLPKVTGFTFGMCNQMVSWASQDHIMTMQRCYTLVLWLCSVTAAGFFAPFTPN